MDEGVEAKKAFFGEVGVFGVGFDQVVGFLGDVSWIVRIMKVRRSSDARLAVPPGLSPAYARKLPAPEELWH